MSATCKKNPRSGGHCPHKSMHAKDGQLYELARCCWCGDQWRVDSEYDAKPKHGQFAPTREAT